MCRLLIFLSRNIGCSLGGRAVGASVGVGPGEGEREDVVHSRTDGLQLLLSLGLRKRETECAYMFN